MRFSTVFIPLLLVINLPSWQAFGQEATSPGPVPTHQAIAQQFADQLAKRQDLTWEEWQAQLPKREHLVDRPNLDPQKADFFGAVQAELTLDQRDIEKLKETGLVLIDPKNNQSFPAAYYRLYSRDLPLLITTDSILHALHRSYDKILIELESNHLRDKLNTVLADAHGTLADWVDEYPEAELYDTYMDVDTYLTVARTLLAEPSAKRPAVIQPAMNRHFEAPVLVDCILNAKTTGMTKVAIFGGERRIDFTQFIVRGHYTRSSRLSSYFRCMMWLGRPDCGWNVLPTDPSTGIVSNDSRELRNAALLVRLMQATGHMVELEEMESILAFMVGRSDNLTASALSSIIESAGIITPHDLLDSTKMKDVQTALLESGSGEQTIRSQALSKPWGSTMSVRPPEVFQLFGQRFTVDSFALSKVVYDSIVFQGEPMLRSMPTGLDAMAALGNDLAVRLLEPELKKWNYSGNLAALQDVIRDLPEAYWKDHVYGGWVHALGELDRDLSTEPGLPQVFRTEAWRKKQLQTQLASWSELRHDTILYAKASYSVPSCEVPVAYVEPYPEFYAALEKVAQRAAKALEPIPAPKPPSRRATWGSPPPTKQSYSKFFQKMAEHLATLTELARKEIAREPFTQAETEFLQKTISQKGSMLFGSGAVNITLYDGWYVDLLYGFCSDEQKTWQATIADVHTDVQNGQVLEVGVGPVDYCVIVADQDSHSKVFVGPTYSYYEFAHPASDRMTDGAWQASLRRNDHPARPEFIQAMVGGASAKMSPVVTTQRDGDRLMVSNGEQPMSWLRRKRAARISIDRDGLTSLASQSPGVRHLDLSGVELAAEDLSPLAQLVQIRAVNLNGTSIPGEGLKHLACSTYMRGLALSKTRITDDSLAMIKHWSYLEELDLSDTEITDRGLVHLYQSRYLRKLNLRGTKVTADGLAALRSTLPECNIVTTATADDK